MKTIHLLPQSLIAQIAAGEVIEKPAYVVKELIDNSIDAGADRITIHLEESGLRKIIIHDNGSGMSTEDLLESFKLHTTSKISKNEELQHIQSLGFRGEALASIAAVSQVIIQSRTKEQQVGTEIEIYSGNIIRQSAVGMPIGTTVIVRHLFSHLPGRKKFLKSPQTELRYSMHTLIHQAVSHPHITFSLSHNRRNLLFEQKTHSYVDRLHLLFSGETQKRLFPILVEEPYMSMQGYISLPTARFSAYKQYVYINRRHVHDNTLNQAVKKAYASLLPPNIQPAFIVLLTLPYELVDVNVHPRKEQVAIGHKEKVIIAVEDAVRHALQAISRKKISSGLFTSSIKSTGSFSGLFLQEHVQPFLVKDKEKAEEIPLQVHETFIIIPHLYGFSVFDQHASHERILYEQFKKAFIVQQKKIKHFVLPQPQELDLSAIDIPVMQDYEKLLKKLGFGFYTKNDKIFLERVPLLFQDRNYTELILELLQIFIEDLNSSGVKKIPLDGYTNVILCYLACRKAIKAGDRLHIHEMQRLLTELEKTPNNMTCPHGRPTQLHVGLDELYKVFYRS